MCLIRTGFIFIKHTIQNRPIASGLFCVLFLCMPQRVFQLSKRDAVEEYTKTILSEKLEKEVQMKISPTLRKTSYCSDKKRTLNILRMQGTNYPECLIIRVLILLYAKLTRMSIKIKELFYNASYEYKRNRYACSDYLQSIEDDIGKEFIRNHFANDFRYFKVHKDSGRRAVYPKSFKNY